MTRTLASLDDDLIALLRDDGRMSISAMSRALGAPRSLVTQRLSTLLLDGHVTIAAILNPAAIGLEMMGLLLIRCEGSPDQLAATAAHFPATSFVSLTSGPHDVVVEVRARSRHDLFTIIEQIRALDDVRRVSTVSYVDIMKSPYTSDIEQPRRVEMDHIDRDLVDLLQGDGRMSYRAISDELGISDSTARARLARLLDDRVIRVTAIAKRNEVTHSFAMGLGINASGDAGALAERLRGMGSIEFAATSIGEFDLILTLSTASLESLQRIASDIRSDPAVAGMTTWVHLRLVKESYRQPAELLTLAELG